MSQLCRSCAAPILWRKTTNADKPCPVDVEPSPEGTVLLLGQGRCTVLTKAQAELRRENGEALHTAHWATCPNADRHRAAAKVSPAQESLL